VIRLREKIKLSALGVVLAGVIALPHSAAAQGIGLLNKSKNPVVIEADQGVEWRRKDKIYVARGNATATQGKTRIRANELKAHYRQGADGKTQIWKVTATGKVDIKTEKETATGDVAIYMVETGVFILRGRNLKLATKKQTITATDRIEYRSKDRRAYVIGNAKVVEDDKVIRASRFVAFLKDGKDGKVTMRRVEARGGVIITTKSEIIRADRGDYNGETKLATLTGNVKLTRGDNQLNGEKAIVNLETGISRMVGRVKVLLVPREGAEGKKRQGFGAPDLSGRGKPKSKSKQNAGRRLGAGASPASGDGAKKKTGDAANRDQRASRDSDAGAGDSGSGGRGRVSALPRLRGSNIRPQ